MLEKFITFMLVGRDEEKGATATEYGLLVGLIALIIVAGVGVFGDALERLLRRPRRHRRRLVTIAVLTTSRPAIPDREWPASSHPREERNVIESELTACETNAAPPPRSTASWSASSRS